MRFPRASVPYIFAMLLALVSWPRSANAQVVSGGDFDVCDFCGTLRGNTAFLTGRVGFGTDRAVFRLINAATSDQDVDHDGYTPGVDFTNLVVNDTSDFVNVLNPAFVIPRKNLVIADFLNPLNNGFQNDVSFYVNIPNGTPAGRYQGRFNILDRAIGIGLNANGEPLRTDHVDVQIEVLPQSTLGLVGENGGRLDSLTVRGKPGQTVSGVARIANLGNQALTNVRVETTDLIATSGTGLRIRHEQVTFSPTITPNIALGDTARVVVTVRIPLGILAGNYRGDLIVQGDGVSATRIPFTVVVTTPGDVVFENNPVYGRNGDNAVIIFNADAGTKWDLCIFDMMAVTTFCDRGTVFAGSTGTATGGGATVQFTGDQAVRTSWTLKNGRGEGVAAGMYYVIVNAVQEGQRRQLRSKLMVIR